MTKSITAVELVKYMDNLWSTTSDIQRIGSIGKNRAYKIMQEIRNQMIDDGMIFPDNMVSTEYVIKYFNINEKRIRHNAMVQMGGKIDE